MDTNLRPSGIEGLGGMAWGTHFCLFYETKEDLLDILIPYFKAGLEIHEFFLCVASPPLSSEEVQRALREAVPDFERYLAEGQIEIVSYRDWLLTGGELDAQRVLQNWIAKLNWALAKGYAGLRFVGDPSWLDKQAWGSVPEFEKQLDQIVSNSQMLGLCAYALERCSAADVLEVVHHHQFTVAKQNGVWEHLESSKLKRAHDEIRQLNTDLERRVLERTAHLAATNEQLRQEVSERKRSEEALRASEARLQAAIDAADMGLWDWDLVSGQVISLGHHDRLFGFAPSQFDGTHSSFEKRIHPNDLEELNRVVQHAREEHSEYAHEYRIVWLDGSIHWIAGRGRFVYNETDQAVRMYGAVLDITERKQAEEALRRSESNFRTLADKSLQGITIVQKQRIVYANPAISKITGYTVEELKSMSVEQLMALTYPIDRPTALERARKRMAGEALPPSIELRILRKDGSTSWVQAFNNPIEYNGQSALLSSTIDTTERKAAEEAIRKSEQVLREAESLGHTGSWEQNLVTGEIFNTEENLRLFFGDNGSKGTLFEDYAQAVHPDDREYVLQRRAQLLTERGSSDIEYRVVWPDGSVHVIFGRATVVRDELGQPVRVYGTNVDITERKQAEEALRLSEQRFQLLTETIPILVWSARADGVSDYYNAPFLQYLGKALEEMQGWVWVDTLHPEDRERSSAVWTQAFSSGSDYEIEYRIQRAGDGQYRWHLGRAVPLRDSSGKIVRWYGTCTDIHDRKQAEEKIRQYVGRMEELAEISRALEEVALDYPSVLNTLARRTAELIGDSCVITLFSDDKQRSFPVAFHHPNPKALAMMREALLHTWQGGIDTQRYQTLLAGNPIYIPSVNPEEFRASLEPEFQHYFDAISISSVLIVPLKAQGRVIGTLGITRDHQGKPYTRDDLIMLQNIADRAAMSIQNARLFEQVQGAREQLEALSRRLLEVQEAERRALTTELHDRVGQNLTALSINLQNMKALLSTEAAQKLATKFDDAQTLVQDTTRHIRDIMAELYLPELEDYGLAAALETYAERAALRGNLETIIDLPDLAPPPLSFDIIIAFFRAAQEAISNVLKHANATQLEINLREREGRIRLRIEDDGQGFEPDTVSQKEAQTWGLKIMRERIESIGGTVRIESEPGQGTRVTFEIERHS